jgi:hypothetical protein
MLLPNAGFRPARYWLIALAMRRPRHLREMTNRLSPLALAVRIQRQRHLSLAKRRFSLNRQS